MTLIEYGGINPFNFRIKHTVTKSKNNIKAIDSHIHDECEIYVNLTGNVSFMVENRLYPVSRGDAIITRPYEYHHCVYKDDFREHDHFWILFSVSGNEKLFDLFFKRGYGENNLITLEENEREELIRLCSHMTENELSELEKYECFFRIIGLLNKNNQGSELKGKMSPDMALAISYIEKNLTDELSIADIADAIHVSVNTIERRFHECLKLTPTEFIRRKRLIRAAGMLREGYSVLEAGVGSGFNDNSYFIKLFRENYGITPLQYKKRCNTQK